VIQLLLAHRAAIKGVEAKMAELSRADPEVERPRAIPGMGTNLALTILGHSGDFSRFDSSDAYAALLWPCSYPVAVRTGPCLCQVQTPVQPPVETSVPSASVNSIAPEPRIPGLLRAETSGRKAPLGCPHRPCPEAVQKDLQDDDRKSSSHGRPLDIDGWHVHLERLT